MKLVQKFVIYLPGLRPAQSGWKLGGIGLRPEVAGQKPGGSGWKPGGSGQKL